MATGTDAALDVGRLRLLREVALRGTIAAAARSLGLTASAVSQQLAVLEREAGTALLERTSRGVLLTGAGRALCDRAAQVLDVLAAARADLDRLTGSLTGPVSIAAVASAAAAIVSPAQRLLRESSPGIAPTVVVAEPSRSLELLAADDVDIAIVDEYDYVPLALADHLVAVDLCVEPLVLVTPRDGDLPLASISALAEHDWVMPPDTAACGVAVRSACRAAGFEPRVRWDTDDMLLLVRAVAAGHGVAVLPRMAVPVDVAPVRIATLQAPVLRRRLRAIVRSGSRSRPVVQAVLAALVETAAAAAQDASRPRVKTSRVSATRIASP
jgi:molybdate transport repressor ModE-like protein